MIAFSQSCPCWSARARTSARVPRSSVRRRGTGVGMRSTSTCPGSPSSTSSTALRWSFSEKEKANGDPEYQAGAPTERSEERRVGKEWGEGGGGEGEREKE